MKVPVPVIILFVMVVFSGVASLMSGDDLYTITGSIYLTGQLICVAMYDNK